MADTPPPAGQQPAATPRITRQFLRNLLTVGISGVLISWWLRAFTESFGIVISILGLGGLLAWLGFIWSFVGKDRQEAIRSWAAGLFESQWPARIAISGLFLLFLTSLGCGTVRVENIQGGDAVVRVYHGKPSAEDEPERLANGSERNFPQWMWPWESVTVHVKVAGLPSREVRVRPWWWQRGPEHVQVPGAFLRPVVLIGGPRDLVTNAKPETHRITIVVNDVAQSLPYDGRALLIGVDDNDLNHAPALAALEDWKTALKDSNAAARLMPPKAGVVSVVLHPGDKVTAFVTGINNARWEAWPVTLSQPVDRSAIVVPIFLTKSENE